MLPAEKTLLAGFLLAAVLITAGVVALPVENLVGVVPDDAFYYFAIGRHAAASGHPSFDGENPASGFHPAWMLAVTAAARCLPDHIALLRAAVAMSFACHLVAGWLLVGIFKRFMPGKAAVLAAGVWMFSYLPLLTAAFALETSLYCFAFLASYSVYLGRIEPHLHGIKSQQQFVQIPTRSLVWFGAALGFCILARTEGMVLLACAAGWLAVAAILESRSWRNWLEGLRRGFIACTAALAVISPWLVYSLCEFGTIHQASGLMKTLWMQEEAAKLGFFERFEIHAVRYAEWLAYATPWTWNGNVAAAAAMAAAWLGVFLGLIIFVKRGPMEHRKAIFNAMPAVAYPLLHVAVAGAVYSVFFADVQCWYLALPCLECHAAIAIVGGAVYAAQSRKRQPVRWPAKVLAVAVVLTILGLVRFGQTLHAGYWPWQRDVYAQIEPIEKMLPPDAKLGCFNAGIPGYFGHRTVVNLDGLVNDAVVPYWREKRFDDYLRAAGIEAIADEELSLARAKRFSRDFPPLHAIAEFPLTNFTCDKRFMWLLDEKTLRQP